MGEAPQTEDQTVIMLEFHLRTLASTHLEPRTARCCCHNGPPAAFWTFDTGTGLVEYIRPLTKVVSTHSKLPLGCARSQCKTEGVIVPD